MHRIKIGIAMIMLVTVVGCIGFNKKDTAIGLVSAKDTLVATATAAKQMCEQNIISPEECAEIENKYAMARQLLIQAKEIWTTMSETDDFSMIDSYERMINAVFIMVSQIETSIQENK